MRRALKTDVKARNARKQSKYYEKHGGPPLTRSTGGESRKRRRDEDEEIDEDGDDTDSGGRRGRKRLDARGDIGSASTRERELAELDAELDRFAAGEQDPASESVAADGNSTVPQERSRQSLADRIGLAIPTDGRKIASLPGQRRGGRGKGGGKTNPKPTVDKDALDAELDAFLLQKDG